MRRAQGVTEQLILERIMRNLVHGKEEKEDLSYLVREFYFAADCLMQMAVVVPTIQMEMDNNEMNYFALSIKNICVDLFDSQGEGITFEDNDGKLMIAVFETVHSDDIINRIGLLKNILKDEYGITSRVVVGGPVKGFDKLKISYNDAVYLLDTEKGSIQEIIQTRFSEDRYRIFNEVFTELKRIMVINTGNLDSVMKAYDTFKQATESYNLANTMVKRCSFDIASTLYFSYISNTGETVDSRLNSLLSSLMNAEKEDVLSITAEFITQLFNGEEENIHEIIYKSKAYIREHLAEDLSVSSLAAQLYITPNYFSRLFKKVTGEGCSEYIVRMRIEKAKALLETTSLKTGKIAFMVGYNDTNYFSLAFKKFIGISPTKYRDTFFNQKSNAQ
jgi:two-component system response regulator YesN